MREVVVVVSERFQLLDLAGPADALRAALLRSAGDSGFAEYVDPYTGEACGAQGFGWTAALTLDLLHEPLAGGDGDADADDSYGSNGSNGRSSASNASNRNDKYSEGVKGGDRL